MNSEIFKTINDFPNYKISNKGNVLSIKTNKILKNRLDYKTKKYSVILYRGHHTDPVNYLRKDVLINHLLQRYFHSYLIYFETNNNQYRTFDSLTKQISTLDALPKGINNYFMLKGKDFHTTDEGLLNFVNAFEQNCKELRYNKTYSINYKNYYTHYAAVRSVYGRLSNNQYKLSIFKDHDLIGLKESEWIEKCSNGGIMFCEPGTYECVGYDKSSFYPHLLNSDKILIPSKEGNEITLQKLPLGKDLQLGYYHVKITCDNKEFRKVFSFSPDNVYTHSSLRFAKQKMKQFGVKIVLVKNNKPNAYVYSESVTSKSLFSTWFEKLYKLKQLYPKNYLLKHLLSSLYGHLIKYNITTVSEDDIINNNIDVSVSSDTKYIFKKRIHIQNNKGEETYHYKLLLREQPYKSNLRIKAFLVAEARNEIAKLALYDLDNVVRIYIDNVTIKNNINNAKIDLEKFKVKIESKTTGNICFENSKVYNPVKPIVL